MAAESHHAEVCLVMSLVVRAMVSNRDAVAVIPIANPGRTTIIQVTVAPGLDTGAVIGKGGRTARSLRIILQTISQQQGVDYSLDINANPTKPYKGAG